MSRHEGVSCDSCLKGNFRGRRYKCLICYDYDLCSGCYETGATTNRHTADHPMQCILTRTDFDLYYGGEVLNSTEQPLAYTCPYCNRMGFTENTLLDHVTTEHSDISVEVVCPICASVPGGDPNLMTDDFAGHLTLEHRTRQRDLISFLDEPMTTRHNVRRIPHSSRGATGPVSRRSNMHFSSPGLSNSRDVDPIAELLSQLSGVRRPTTSTLLSASTPSQLQQLQIQLQLEQQQAYVSRQQLKRLPRRQLQTSVSGSGAPVKAANLRETNLNANSETVNDVPNIIQKGQAKNCQFLLGKLLKERENEQISENLRADRNIFIRQLLFSTLVKRDEVLKSKEMCESQCS